MIRRTVFQGLALALTVFAVWTALSQVDFMSLFNVHKAGASTEEKLGKIFWEAIERTEKVIRNDSVVSPIKKIVAKIAETNGIKENSIKVYVIDRSDINAFAMPGNRLIIYTGLINDCKNESELAGVIGHEMAHILKRHVMKKLVKELGLSVVLSMATGGRSSQTISEVSKLISSSAYDRTLESEADLVAVDYMINAGFDPEKFADLMYRMSDGNDLPEVMYYISTHPESESRATEILEYINGKDYTVKGVLSEKEWKSLLRNVAAIK